MNRILSDTRSTRARLDPSHPESTPCTVRYSYRYLAVSGRCTSGSKVPVDGLGLLLLTDLRVYDALDVPGRRIVNHFNET